MLNHFFGNTQRALVVNSYFSNDQRRESWSILRPAISIKTFLDKFVLKTNKTETN
jgi:hypothetical protein